MLLALTLACAPKAPPETRPVTPRTAEELLARAGAEPLPAALAVPFGVVLSTPSDKVSVSGALLYAAPDRFRVELRGPIGGPALILVSDGAGLSAWQAGPNRYVTSADADALLRARTGGGLGLETLAAILIGRLPVLGPPVSSEVVVGGARYAWTPAESVRAEAWLDGVDGRLWQVAVSGPGGAPWLGGTLEPGAPGALGPESLRVELPTLGASAVVDYGAWSVANPLDAAFVLPVPAGAEVVPLALPGATD
jgi:hypothetical protein